MAEIKSEDEGKEDVLDAEKIISEVQCRPALYNNELKEYSDRVYKHNMWTEVFSNVVHNWNNLSMTEKERKGKDVLKRWKHLRDCFTRELSIQRNTPSGRPAKKRRKYMYFDSLSFLLPFTEGKPKKRSMKSERNCSEDSQDNLLQNTEDEEKHHKRILRPHSNLSREKQKETVQGTPPDSTSLYNLLNTICAKEKEEIDEDKSFAQMLVPMLKKLDDDQKHYAKIEILNVMRNARNGFFTPIFPNCETVYSHQDPESHRYQAAQNMNKNLNTDNEAQRFAHSTPTIAIKVQNPEINEQRDFNFSNGIKPPVPTPAPTPTTTTTHFERNYSIHL